MTRRRTDLQNSPETALDDEIEERPSIFVGDVHVFPGITLSLKKSRNTDVEFLPDRAPAGRGRLDPGVRRRPEQKQSRQDSSSSNGPNPIIIPAPGQGRCPPSEVGLRKKVIIFG